jgi:hypothetical protein
MDFYLSDPARQQWDNLLTHAETLVDGDFEHREQVVHWVRSFPFAFLSDRSYTIGRRMFELDGILYGISKIIKFPGHDSGRTIRMDNYWSMWSCTPCPCPFGTGVHRTSHPTLRFLCIQLLYHRNVPAHRNGVHYAMFSAKNTW